eukprot:3111232-Amphidinium_carterae.9
MAPKKGSIPKEAEPEDVTTWIQKFGKPGSALDRRELSLLFACYEVCGQCMVKVATDFVHQHGEKALLMQYSQDCMASKLRQHVSGTSGSLKVRRSGIQTEELLVQSVFLTAEISPGRYGHCVLFGPPLKCSFGKDGASLAGLSTVQPGLNIVECNSLAFRIRHFVLDRGVPSDVPVFLSAHILEQSRVPAEDDEDDDDDEEGPSHLTELHTSVSCACHDGHNALKWSALIDFNSEQRMQSIYIACAAMRSSFLKCFAVLPLWIRSVLQPIACEMLPSADRLRSLWSTLQVTDASLELLVQFRLHWTGAILHVAEEAIEDEGWLESLTTLLMSLWRLPSWTASRWLTIGTSCRSYAVAALTGFEAMLAFLGDTGTGSAYDQAGYERLDSAAKDFMIVTGLVSFTSEAFLAAILRDNRLAMHRDEVFQLCQSTHGFLEEIDWWVWEQISTVTGELSASALRSRVIRGSLSSLAYLEHRVFGVLRKGPWCYCSGDVREHVQTLKELVASDCDPVTRKLVIWAKAGIADEKLEDVISLLSQCSFSSHFAERQHSSTAQMKKFHDYTYETLAVRSYMHAFRQLLVLHDPVSKEVARLQRELRTLLGKQPQKTGAKQMYLAEMVEKGKALQARGKIVDNTAPQRTAMKHHSKHYEVLPDEQKRKFEELAVIHRSAASDSLSKRARTVQEELAVAEQSAQILESRNPSSMLLSACRWEKNFYMLVFIVSTPTPENIHSSETEGFAV